MNTNLYEWTSEAIRQNSMVADRDYEIALLKQKLAHYESLPRQTFLEWAEQFFMDRIIPFFLGVLTGVALIVMRITQ
jgi:hypothetical protein